MPSLTHSGTGASLRCMPQLNAIWWVASCTRVDTSPAAAGLAMISVAALPGRDACPASPSAPVRSNVVTRFVIRL